MKKILEKLKCKLGIHKNELYLEKTTIYKCGLCGKFKSGPAMDTDGLEIFVFSDGSCIKGISMDND